MQILIHADAHIDVSEDLASRIQDRIQDRLSRFSPRIRRIDVHLSDINAVKFDVNDKECVLQIFAARLSPMTVTDRAPSSALAIEGATEKAARLLAASFEQEGGYPGSPTIRTMPVDKNLA